MTEKQSKKPRRGGWFMLAVMLVSYAITALIAPAKAYLALNNSLDALKMVAPILLLVFFIMTLLHIVIRPKRIAKYLGKESGMVGWLVALAGGVLCHGSNYMWYPILSELRNHGARDGLIVAFFYARAIKLPWLPAMIGYFGITFSLVLSIYILLGACMQGLIVDKVAAQNR